MEFSLVTPVQDLRIDSGFVFFFLDVVLLGSFLLLLLCFVFMIPRKAQNIPDLLPFD